MGTPQFISTVCRVSIMNPGSGPISTCVSMVTCFQMRLPVMPQPAPKYPLGDSWRTWERERREVLESVAEELQETGSDPDSRQACVDLLRHLARR